MRLHPLGTRIVSTKFPDSPLFLYFSLDQSSQPTVIANPTATKLKCFNRLNVNSDGHYGSFNRNSTVKEFMLCSWHRNNLSTCLVFSVKPAPYIIVDQNTVNHSIWLIASISSWPDTNSPVIMIENRILTANLMSCAHGWLAIGDNVAQEGSHFFWPPWWQVSLRARQDRRRDLCSYREIR